jgi:hypothetical protein
MFAVFLAGHVLIEIRIQYLHDIIIDELYPLTEPIFQVGYSTAMDIYVILCFVSVFAALVEFACINFIDTFIKREAKDKESNPTLLQVDRLSQAESP